MTALTDGTPQPLAALLGLTLAPRGPAYTLVKLLEGMQSPQMPVSLYAPTGSWSGPLPFPLHSGIGGAAMGKLTYPLHHFKLFAKWRAERRLLRHLRAPQFVYTWGEVSLRTSEALHEAGHKVVREKFNCAKKLTRDLLQVEYAELGEPQQVFDDELIEKETRELALADAIYCPSPMVTASLKALGIPEDRLLPTSYGWDPERFAQSTAAVPRPSEGQTLLFVGQVCVRKGAHILLEAWERSKIKGRLLLVGGIEPLIKRRYEHILARDDVSYIPYTDDIASFYRSADWFVFPTLEEGGPQVTYEAGGLGVPVVVSQMGAGAFARDGIDGIVTKDTSLQTWTDTLRSLPDLVGERARFGENARLHALDFTYDKVGAQRRELLLARLGTRA